MPIIDSNRRNCYCILWETHPEMLTKRNIPYGYCGVCDCGEWGHLRHAPDGIYTTDFCDDCYRKLEFLNILRLGFVIITVASVIFRHWLILIMAIVLLVFTFIWRNDYFEKYQAKLKSQKMP